MATYTAPRGLSDVLPAEQPYWRFVRDTAEHHAQRYGYQPIDSAVFEDIEVFARGIGEGTDIVEKEMFLLQPRTEEARRYALRPEATAGLCRAYLEHGMSNLPAPVRLYWWGVNFRYERPQAGRLRQFTQIDLEAFGSDDPMLDAEIITYAWELYRGLGLTNLTLAINSIGDRASRGPYIETLRDYFRPHLETLDRDDQMRFDKNPLRLLDSKNERTRALLEHAPDLHDALSPEGRTHFEKVQAYLRAAAIPYVVDKRLVRGFDYYTHTVFEIGPPDAARQGVIGGGGRYDGLIELFGGKPTPAVGFATGVERIILNLKRQEIVPPQLAAPQIYIAPLGDDAAIEGMRLAHELRAAGAEVLQGLGSRSVRAHLRAANTAEARFAVIIGADELASGSYQLKDLAANTSDQVDRTAIVARLTESRH